MNVRTVVTGAMLLVTSVILFLDSSLIATRPPLFAGWIVGIATLLGTVMLGTATDGRSV